MTAKETYEIKRTQVTVQLEMLTKQLNELDKDHENDPKDWGVIGNLGHIHSNLERILDFLVPEIE